MGLRGVWTSCKYCLPHCQKVVDVVMVNCQQGLFYTLRWFELHTNVHDGALATSASPCAKSGLLPALLCQYSLAMLCMMSGLTDTVHQCSASLLVLFGLNCAATDS